MLGIGLVNMAVALDQTVVSTALPSIVSELHGFEYYAWVASGYFLASLVTVPVFGRLGDFFGRKRFVIAAVIVFTGASVLCGLAGNMPFLVFARGLQGIGGGMMVGTAFASIPDLFPDPRARIRWQVIMSAAYGIGTAAGPSLGGWLSQHYGWRSTFLVNLPVGILALYFISVHLPTYRRAVEGKVLIDWTGAVLIALVLGGFQIFIEAAANGFTPANLVLGVLIVIGAIALVACERRASHPILPLELFHEPKLVTLFALSVLTGFVMFSLIFFAPLLLQGGFGLTPPQAGLLATPIAVCAAIGSAANTRIVIHLSKPTHILTIGYGLMVLASLGVAWTTSTTPRWTLEVALGGAGIGLGFILNNLNVFAQEIVGRSRVGIATALLQSTRMVGGMLGTSIVAIVINRCYEARIHSILLASAEQPAGTWYARLADPRILVDSSLREVLLSDLHRAGLAGASLVESARLALVSSIHVGVLLTTASGCVALVLVRKIAGIRLHRKEI
ncbi:MFS transporter [Paraburkholderia caribensis]|nr:MFS transporter [Paraburkholderia caribensis]